MARAKRPEAPSAVAEDPLGRPRQGDRPARTAARPARCCASRPAKERVYVEGLNMVKRHTAPAAQVAGAPRREAAARRRDRARGPDPRLQRDAARRAKASPTRVRIEREDGKRVPRRQDAPARGSTDDARRPQTAPPARLKIRYLEEIRPALVERFGYSSVMQAPKLEKITLNMGVGLAKQDSKVLKAATEQLATIAGQQPSVRRARKSIAAFKLREGMPVGVAVTLRGERGYEFLDRLDLGRDPADPRLPRAEPALLRRPRQLLDGRQGADHLPRDRLRRDRPGARSRHHDHDERRQRRRGVRAARGARDAVRPQGRPKGYDPAADAADADRLDDRQRARHEGCRAAASSPKPAAAAAEPAERRGRAAGRRERRARGRGRGRH